jgi:dipeptidyl aminopeptidase/acylaminoacyl peptidase
LVLAEWHGRTRAFSLSDRYTELPSNGSVTAIQQLGEGTVLITASSFNGPASTSLLKASGHTQLTESKPLSDVKAEEFWFDGADGRRVMAWVMRPKTKGRGKAPMGESQNIKADASLLDTVSHSASIAN